MLHHKSYIDDVKSILSTHSTNFVTVGLGEGGDALGRALKDAFDKLPVATDSILSMLLNVWIPKNLPPTSNFRIILTDFISQISSDINLIWGVFFDESLKINEAKVTLISSSKL